MWFVWKERKKDREVGGGYFNRRTYWLIKCILQSLFNCVCIIKYAERRSFNLLVSQETKDIYICMYILPCKKLKWVWLKGDLEIYSKIELKSIKVWIYKLVIRDKREGMIYSIWINYRYKKRKRRKGREERNGHLERKESWGELFGFCFYKNRGWSSAWGCDPNPSY